jgi:putative transposase
MKFALQCIISWQRSHVDDWGSNKMPDFRRYYVPNAFVFITLVTHNRKHFLHSEKDILLLRETLRNVQALYPFHFLAYIILPDHCHWLMDVCEETGNFSKAMHSIKRNFTLNYKKVHFITVPFHIWQERFWDHVIRDEHDLIRHIDYIHWNPVWHGYVHHPEDWPHSSFEHWRKRGYYPERWGWSEEPATIKGMKSE